MYNYQTESGRIKHRRSHAGSDLTCVLRTDLTASLLDKMYLLVYCYSFLGFFSFSEVHTFHRVE
jgi:hypothetical protein